MCGSEFKSCLIKLYVKTMTEDKYMIAALGMCAIGTVLLTEGVSYAETATVVSDTQQGASVVEQDKDIVQAVTALVNNLKTTIVDMSTPAAVCGVGYGAFLKKFSLGKPDRIETGNKVITNSIWGWVIVNGLPSILNWAGKYIGAAKV